MAKTSVTKAKAEKLAKFILRLNENGKSYRDIQHEYFRNVPAGTLNRIAKSGGAWLPKGEPELMALGLIAYRKPRRLTPRHLNNDEKTQSWFLWERGLAKSMKTPTPRELTKEHK